MIIRYAGRSVPVAAVTSQAVRAIFEAQDVRGKLQAATLELVRVSANGPSLALRRLNEKVGRLTKRLARYEQTVLRDAPDNPDGKASAINTVRPGRRARTVVRQDAAGTKADRRAAVRDRRTRNAAKTAGDT